MQEPANSISSTPAEPTLLVDSNTAFLQAIIDGKKPPPGPSLQELMEQNDLINANTLAPDRQRAIAERKWFAYLFALHSNEERPKAFQQVMHLMTDQEYWEHLGEVWTCHDGSIILSAEPMETWLKLFKSKRSWRSRMMTAEERQVLSSLPAKVKVYRGCRAGREREMSWTVSERVARHFAVRAKQFNGSKVECGILSATVYRSGIFAYFDGRQEQEVVLDPTGVRFQLHGVTA